MGRAHEVRAASMAKTAAAKSKVYAKHGKLIYMAAKNGVPDPDMNPSLKTAIDRAKRENVPADNIKRAIEKAKGGAQENYIDVRYEGFGPNNSLIIVDCLTDNVNRTFTNIRTAFSRCGCKLGVGGSVTHMFDYLAVFSFEGLTEEEVLDLLLGSDCDVKDVESEDGLVSVYAPHTEYGKIREVLTTNNPEINLLEDEIRMVPQSYVDLTDAEDIKHFRHLEEQLDEIDDVQNVYHNAIITE